jgi:hypothetical protein
MSKTEQQELPAPDVLAAALLRTWICGDAGRLKTELSRSLDCTASMEHGLEGERCLLLRTVVIRIQGCSDWFAPRRADPALDLCIDLLIHLAKSDRPRVS